MKEMKYLMSILIPVYNAEKTIDRCLKSIISQMDDRIEVVIVNDGSTDKTCLILNDYARKYDNIHIYNQINSGVSITRNNLLENTSGKYVLFCDSDDYLKDDAIIRILDVIENNEADAYFFGYTLSRSNSKKNVERRTLTKGIYKKEQWKKEHINGTEDLYWSALWNKCYKYDLIRKDEIIKFYPIIEDVLFNVEYLKRCETIFISDAIIYNYVQVGQSITRGKKYDNEKAIIDAFYAIKKLYINLNDAYPSEKKDINYVILLRLIILVDRAKKINRPDIITTIKNSAIYRMCLQIPGGKVLKIYIHFLVFSMKQIIKRRMYNGE